MTQIVKKMLKFMTLLALFVNSANQTFGFSLPSLYKASPIDKKQCDLTNCICLINAFETTLLFILGKLHSNLDYWQMAQRRLFGYFVEKGPHRWFFGKSQTNEISEAISLTNLEIKLNAEYLGYINELKKNLENNSNKELEQSVISAARRLHAILQFTPIDQLETSIKEDAQSFNQLLTSNQQLLSAYKKHAFKRFKNAQAPSHTQRHWVAYGFGTVCTLLGASYYLKHKDELRQWKKDAECAARNFYAEYIKDPAISMWDIFWGREEDSILLDIKKTSKDVTTDVENGEKMFQNLVKTCYRDNETDLAELLNDELIAKTGKSNEPPTQEKLEECFNKFIDEICETKKLPDEFDNQIVRQMRNALRHMLMPDKDDTSYFAWLLNKKMGKRQEWDGQLVRQIFIKVVNKINIFENAFLSLIKVAANSLHSNRLTYQLFVGLPGAALLGLASYLSYKVLGKLYRCISPEKTFIYKPIKQALVNFETILNASLSEELSYATKGQLYYWHHKLARAVSLTPAKTQAQFAADLVELDTPALTVQQKLNTVQRMFRTYPFLGSVSF